MEIIIEHKIICDNFVCPGHRGGQKDEKDFVYDAGKIFYDDKCRAEYYAWINKNILGLQK